MLPPRFDSQAGRHHITNFDAGSAHDAAPRANLGREPSAPCDTLCPRGSVFTGHWPLTTGFMREIISTKDAPQAIGPYSQAIKANGFVFTSGQVAIDPSTQQVITGDAAA